MFDFLLFLHVLAAVFVIGPLAHATTTASRGLRKANAAATAESARMTTVYSYASVLVVILGFGLMSATDPDTGKAAAEFSDLWIWSSVLLWLAAAGLALGVVAPTLRRATVEITEGRNVTPLTARVAAAGGVIGLLLAGIVALMIYQPGS